MLEVERQAVVPELGRHVLHRMAIIAAGIVDQHADRAEFSDNSREHGLVGEHVANVAGRVPRRDVARGDHLVDQHPAALGLGTAQRHLRTLRRERPDILVSNGAGLAVPFFWIGKLVFGCRTVYIEVYDRIDSPTFS